MKKYLLIILAIIINLNAKNDYIEIYTSYANITQIHLSGRVIDIKDKKTTTSKSYSAFFNSERKNIPIFMSLNNYNYTSKTDDEGYFVFDINTSYSINNEQDVILKTKDINSTKNIKLFIPSIKKHLGVISDFDDTVIVSNVTNKFKLLYNTFVKSYSQRELVSSIRDQINSIVNSNNLKQNSAFFIISGSPYQLKNNINNFLNLHNFPKREILTKKIHGKNKDSLSATISYKYDKIVKLIKMYPQVTWVLFGDSGEKDAQIYIKVKNNYPNNIKDIYIRDVKTKKVAKLKNELLPFKTDGCSYFPDGTLTNNKKWLNCCIDHDKSYYKGGTKNQKLIADKKLKNCVKNLGYPNIAKLMFFGVQLAGDAKYDTPYRWGYGWKINRYYDKINEKEDELFND